MFIIVFVLLDILYTDCKFAILNSHQTLQQQNIRCSIIGLAAEVRVCRTLCSETQGESLP